MISPTKIRWDFFSILYLSIAGIIGFVLTYLIMPYIIKYMKKKGYVGTDIHKNTRPEVAESGGLGMIIGFIFPSIFLAIIFTDYRNIILIVLITVFIAGIIGFLDDRVRLRTRYKLLLTLLIGSAVFLANYLGFIAIQNPVLPILSRLRLNMIYPILIPLVVIVFANTVNMLEGYNGEGSGTCIIAIGFLLVCSIIWNTMEGLILSVISLSVIIPFYLFNRYPAKIFPGDVGTLSMGVMIASIALFGGLLAAAFCTLLTHISNSFYYISSVRGFFESKEIHELRDDIILLKDDRIRASKQKNALITMPRMILAKGPLSESQLVEKFYLISIISGFLGILTTILMCLTLEAIEILWVIVFSLPCLVIIGLLMYFFPRIRDIAIQMLILYFIGIILLYLIDIIIVPIEITIDLYFIRIPLNIVLSVIAVLPGLGVWYILTIIYLNKQLELE
ncbi:MAG: hypothetical protein GF311_26960 [Candidatus Lokiarchaeota archaeon]|nr:hypothetical protein [Candidatus Lokiarchaeota archaeon]